MGALAVPIGNAANGLCGGMVLTARDLYERGVQPPSTREVPGPGTPLFRYLRRRLFDSFNLPMGPLRYWLWQLLPAGDRFGLHGLAWRTIRGHWPAIRAGIDAGHLVPLGVVRARSINPLRLSQNHQVLAYGYRLDEATSTLAIDVYDPNHPDDDSCVLSLSVADPTGPTAIAYVAGEAPVRGFFQTAYRRPIGQDITRIVSSG